jgi:hypothetical protein
LDLFFSYFKKIVGLHARKKAERFALKGFYIPGAFYLSAIKHILFLTGLLSLLTPVWVQAHTGALAFGYPLAGITIDGDLSDWPAALPRYPIAVPENSATVPDSSDFYASFRVGFNPQESLLYLAVEVQDQSTVADTTGECMGYGWLRGRPRSGTCRRDSAFLFYGTWGHTTGTWTRRPACATRILAYGSQALWYPACL